MLSLVIQRVHLLGIEENPGLLVEDECVVVPAIPKALHDLRKFAGPGIAFVAATLRLCAEVAPLQRIRRCDQIPAGASAADEIQRRKLACEAERLLEAR